MLESLNSVPLLQKCTNNSKRPAITNHVPPLLELLDNNGSLSQSSGKKALSLNCLHLFSSVLAGLASRAPLGTATFLALLGDWAPVGDALCQGSQRPSQRGREHLPGPYWISAGPKVITILSFSRNNLRFLYLE